MFFFKKPSKFQYYLGALLFLVSVTMPWILDQWSIAFLFVSLMPGVNMEKNQVLGQVGYHSNNDLEKESEK